MISFFQWLFWVGLFILFYSYIGYGILLYVIISVRDAFGGRRRETAGQEEFEPEVCLVIAAYNEELLIRKKIENTLAIDYPPAKLDIIFVTDGSTDRTPEILGEYKRIRVMHEAARNGKSVAINRAMEQVASPVIVFCDANTLLNSGCIREIVKHYRNPRVGGVSGEKKIGFEASDKAAGAGEGMYWKYESALKRMDSSLYSVVGAAGELFSMRREHFEALPPDILLDDFILSMRICQKGFEVKYEPRAFAVEAPSFNMKEEQKRKIRIAAGAFQSIILLWPLLNPFRYPVLSFQYISHRVLRWTLCPLCLAAVLLSNTVLAILLPGSFYVFFFGAQALFYISAIVGWILANRNSRWKLLFVPYYLLFMNISVFLGFYRFLKGRQTVLWEKARRSG